MGLKTSELSFDERVKNAKKDKFMRASVAKAQDAQFENGHVPENNWAIGMSGES